MSGPLISADELLGRIDEPDLVIVDCRWYLGEPVAGRRAFEESHIAGAVYADLDTDLSAPPSAETAGGRHPLPNPQTFDRTLGSWGVSQASTVVAYDDRGGAIAARLWWMLTDQGFRDAIVLDGGFDAWRASDGPTESGPPPARTTIEPAGIAIHGWRGVVTIRDIDHAANGIFDARAPERYRGETEPVDPKAGHIPGAQNLPLTDHLDDSLFRSAEEIAWSLDAAGLRAGSVVHCGSGVTACHLILAAEVAGRPRPQLYVGSWSEWSSTDRPIATGPEA